MVDPAELLGEFNDAVERGDLEAFAERIHPNVIWRHNIGVGTPEEGEYEGRENVVALYARILETWEYMRPVPREVRELGDGVLMVQGELYAKHRDAATEIVTPYAQRLRVRDGLLVAGEMVTASGARLD